MGKKLQKPKGCIATECGWLDMGQTEQCKICDWNKPVRKKNNH